MSGTRRETKSQAVSTYQLWLCDGTGHGKVTMIKRPYVQIRGIVDNMHGTCTLQTIYTEEGEEPLIEKMDFMSLESLHKGMKKCIAHAKRHSYDYDVNLINF